ncbi:MAG: 4-hydroxy-tetrahydrodipicolinate synthase [Acidimicrobiales bacterium]
MASSNRQPRFGGVLTAMVTPFTSDGALDQDGAVELARWLVEQGNEGLVLAGTTGESATLSDEEKEQLWRAVARSVAVPVIAGTGSNDTAHTIALTRRAEAAGAAAALVVTPYYNRPSQEGLAAHFEAVARSTELPVVLYDIPGRTGRKIAHETLLRLAEVTNIVGVKYAAGDVVEAARIVAGTGEGFAVYCGDDGLTLPLLAVGAVGVIGVATHWSAPQHAQMLESLRAGDIGRARALNAALLESFAFESQERYPNPLPAKAMLRALGLPAGQCRLPMGAAPPELDSMARDVFDRLQLSAPVEPKGQVS